MMMRPSSAQRPLSPAKEDAEYRRVVGMRIRVWRIVNDISQDQLASKAGVSRNQVSAYERGAQNLDAARLRRIAAVMGVPLGDLLADPGQGHLDVKDL